MKKLFLMMSLFGFLGGSVGAKEQPNILFILTDDLGYGDLSCYNKDSGIPTKHLDQLASEGMLFTDAHSPATVCTPTRYSLMTGHMCFRTGRSRVFSGVGGPCLIDDDRLTLPDMLKAKGYSTAMFGKWHVGMSFYNKEGKRIKEKGIKGVKEIDYSRAVGGSPIEYGFDEFYGTACCPTTDWLYAYIEGDRIPVPPTQVVDKSTLPQHFYACDCRPGMVAPNFDLEEVDLVFLKKSQDFLKRQHEQNPDKPFFLLHSMQAVHLPSFPAKQFQGKTKYGPHGDFIYELDWVVGELMKTLKDLGMAENTIVMFGSDNGPEVPTVIDMRKTYQHDGAKPWRGVKRDAWEGGHRTPFIVKWPGVVKAGSVSDETVSLTDVFATCAKIVGATYPEDAGEDSFDLGPVLKGELGDKVLRPYTIQQTFAKTLSIRVGDWKYLDHKSSGGNNYRNMGEGSMGQYALEEKAPDAPGQLYDLKSDPGETNNLYFENPEMVSRLKKLLDESVKSGRSAPLN